MGSSKVIHALYTDDDVLMSAVKAVKAEKHYIEEIYTPFPSNTVGVIQNSVQRYVRKNHHSKWGFESLCNDWLENRLSGSS